MGLLSRLRELLRQKASDASVPGSVRTSGDLAYSYVQHGNYAAARDILLKALERHGEIRDAAFLNWLLELLAWTWTASDQYREMADFFSTYLSRYPNDVTAYTLRAAAFWYSGGLEKAVEDYSTALRLNSKEISARMGRGQVYAEREEYSLALDDLDFALENLDQSAIADPSHKTQLQAFSLNGRALAHAGLGDLERALAEFDRSISLWPENAWVYFNRATVYEKKGYLDKAIVDYKLSLQKKVPRLNSIKKTYAEFKVKSLLA